MKKVFFVALVAVAAIMSSCGSGTTPAAGPRQRDPVSEFIREARRSAPENALLGVGSSNHSNRNAARTAAEARARADIARQSEAVVKNMVNDYTASSEAEPQALLQFTESVIQTLAQQTQRGAVIIDEDVINGETIVVVILTSESMRNGLLSASQSASALAPHMGAGQWALDRMDAALANQNGLEPVVRRQD
ncbi:MAG: hypothetical protein FWD94_08415 [Treponema sp.]|nr:hypothetical protein [Treponema sp.]